MPFILIPANRSVVKRLHRKPKKRKRRMRRLLPKRRLSLQPAAVRKLRQSQRIKKKT
jgi:hypothetical protein